MRDVYEVLKEKEGALHQIRRELEALRSVTTLLSNTSSPAHTAGLVDPELSELNQQLPEALRTAAPLLVDETEEIDPGIRARLVEAAENDSKPGRVSKISRQLRQFAAPLLGAHFG
jgi:hypothetical protein